jgi:hypothetical protein
MFNFDCSHHKTLERKIVFFLSKYTKTHLRQCRVSKKFSWGNTPDPTSGRRGGGRGKERGREGKIHLGDPPLSKTLDPPLIITYKYYRPPYCLQRCFNVI